MAMETMRGPEQGADLLKERTDRMAAAKEFVDNADGDTKAAIGFKLEAALGSEPSTDRLEKGNAMQKCPTDDALLKRLDFILSDSSAPDALRAAAEKIKAEVNDLRSLTSDGKLNPLGKDFVAQRNALVAAEGAAPSYDADARMADKAQDEKLAAEAAALRSAHEKGLADAAKSATDGAERQKTLQGNADYQRVAAVHSENSQWKARAEANLAKAPHHGPYVTDLRNAEAAYQESSSMLQKTADGAKTKDTPAAGAVQEWLRRKGK